MPILVIINFCAVQSHAKIIFQSLRDAQCWNQDSVKKYWELYSMEDDGSNVTRITNNLYWEDQPDISPDAKKIVFGIHYNPTWETGATDPGWEIAVMDIDGGNLKRLTNNNYIDATPHWNHNGTKIVYVSDTHGDSTCFDIYTMNPDGDSVNKLTDAVTGEFCADPSFSFSDGESKILYIRSQGYTSNWDIYMMNEDGSDKNLILATDSIYLAYHDPMFSPDDSMMVFEAKLSKDGNNGIPIYKIFTAKADGSNIKQITDNDDETDVLPQYSPDGQKFVYFTWKWMGVGFEHKIRTIDTSGANEMVLSTFSPEEMPSWYPEIIGIEEAVAVSNNVHFWSYPNPFSRTTEIRCEIPDIRHETKDQRPKNQKSHVYGPMSKVSLWIYDLTGQLVRNFLITNYKLPHTSRTTITRVTWDGTNDLGEYVSSGIYFLQMEVGKYKFIRKLVKIR